MASRMTVIASKLKRHGGFWFPLLARSLDALYKQLSFGHWLNVWFDTRDIGGAWVSEAYQLLSLLIGFLWLTLIHLPVFTGSAWTILGVTVALYRPFEIVLFSTHWLLVARGPVKDYRRSLAGFLFNFVELGFYVAVAFVLLGSFGPNASPLQILEISIRTVFTLNIPDDINGDAWSSRIATAQIAAAWLLTVLVVANVVGGIARGEFTAKDKDGAA